jgi:hypothetical protein
MVDRLFLDRAPHLAKFGQRHHLAAGAAQLDRAQCERIGARSSAHPQIDHEWIALALGMHGIDGAAPEHHRQSSCGVPGGDAVKRGFLAVQDKLKARLRRDCGIVGAHHAGGAIEHLAQLPCIRD